MKKTKKTLAVVLSVMLAVCFTAPAFAAWEDEEDEGPNMMADALFLRPFGMASTLLGAGFFIITLPFTAITGSTDKAAEKLISKPARFTFNRPLGGSTSEENW